MDAGEDGRALLTDARGEAGGVPAAERGGVLSISVSVEVELVSCSAPQVGQKRLSSEISFPHEKHFIVATEQAR